MEFFSNQASIDLYSIGLIMMSVALSVIFAMSLAVDDDHLEIS